MYSCSYLGFKSLKGDGVVSANLKQVKALAEKDSDTLQKFEKLASSKVAESTELLVECSNVTELAANLKNTVIGKIRGDANARIYVYMVFNREPKFVLQFSSYNFVSMIL